jgi:cyclase
VRLPSIFSVAISVIQTDAAFLDVVADVAKVTFMPITIGGRITTLEAIEQRLKLGADKISINTHAVRDPQFIERAAHEFGSQCIVVSIDARSQDGAHQVFINGGSEATGLAAVEWARRAQDLGAGEILINSIDQDGARKRLRPRARRRGG